MLGSSLMKNKLTVLFITSTLLLTGCVSKTTVTSQTQGESTQSSNSAAPEQTTKVGENYPSDETSFIQTVEETVKSLKGKTDLQQSQLIKERDIKLCAFTSQGQVDNWVGKLAEVGATDDGKAYISIEISSSIVVQTWNNGLSDIFDKTLILPDSAVYAAALKMKKGDKVTFSGNFQTSQQSCFTKENLTEAFYGVDPNFIFHFTQLSPA